MSVINQVLNELEQRGVHTVIDQPMVRAVLNSKRSFKMPLLAVGLVVIAGVVTWLWVHKPKVQLVDVVSTAENSAIPSEIDRSNSPQQLVGAIENASEKKLAPASRLTLELSSLPMQLPTQQNSEQIVSDDKHKTVKDAAPAVEHKTDALMPAAPIPAAKANETVATQITSNAMPIKRVSPVQQADAEFRRAAGLMQQGRIADAIAGYEAALHLDAGHDAARQALVALLLEGKRNAEAEKVLQDGLSKYPANSGHTMLLARLQVERGALDQASATLEKSLHFAGAQPDYRAFLAALLQRQNRHEEAIKNYQIVLQAAPSNGVWLMGFGISLQAVQRNGEAKDVFQRALDTKTLSPELQAFVQQKLKAL